MLSTLRDTVQRYLYRHDPPIIRAVRDDAITYLGRNALRDLYDQVQRIEAERVEGIVLEAGSALGGSAIVMATAKGAGRPLYVYDVFGMIPPPSERDGADVHERYRTIEAGQSEGIGGETYYGYEEDLMGKVAANFGRHGVPVEDRDVHLVKGLYQDTLHVEEPVALAHIDCDWYESVMTCLQRIEPKLSPGGALVIDDYYHWSGCRTAVDEYFSGKRERYAFVKRSRLHILHK